MDFPKSETDIMAFSKRMQNGYSLHAADFPKIILFKLSLTRTKYIYARNTFKDIQSKLRIATKNKNKKFEELKDIMKQSLKKAQVDTVSNPEKLKLIGWSANSQPQPQQIPGQPVNLQIKLCQETMIELVWNRPVSGGKVRNYIIERRLVETNGTNWQSIAVSYKCNVILTNQPKDIQLEYRTIAANKAGISIPSNIVTTIL